MIKWKAKPPPHSYIRPDKSVNIKQCPVKTHGGYGYERGYEYRIFLFCYIRYFLLFIRAHPLWIDKLIMDIRFVI